MKADSVQAQRTPFAPDSVRTTWGGSETAIFNLSDGSTVSFLLPNYTVAYSFPATTCTGVTTCGPGPVGLTAGATISGPVTGTVSTTPQIRANLGVINAGAYGAFTSTAPSSWIEIFGTSLTVGTSGRLWAGVDFNGDNAPTALERCHSRNNAHVHMYFNVDPKAWAFRRP